MTNVFFKIHIDESCFHSRVKEWNVEELISWCKYYGIELATKQDNDTIVIAADTDRIYALYPDGNKVLLRCANDILVITDIVPKIFISHIEVCKLKHRLAEIESQKTKEWEMLLNKFNKNLNVYLREYNDINNICEEYTGAFFLKDYEWELLADNSLKKLFSKRSNNNLMYAIPLDEKYLLRGANVYYFFSCFVKRESPPSRQKINEWIENVCLFLSEAMTSLQEYCVMDGISLRLLLALMDNLRNIILIIINSYYLKEISGTKEGNTYLMNVDDSEQEYKLFESYLSIFQNLLFSNDLSNINNTLPKIRQLINEVQYSLNSFRNYTNYENDGFFLQKCFDPLREMDNFCENYICAQEMAIRINKYGEKINLFSLLCGATEISLMVKNLIKTTECNTILSIQKYGMYLKRSQRSIHNANTCLIANFEESLLDNSVNYLFDENVMTAKTAQLFINDLFSNGITIDKCIFMKYPCIGRTAQIEYFDSCVNLDLVDRFIDGFFKPSSYTNINCLKEKTGKFSVVDEFGIFAKATEIFLKGLYKNNTYTKDSEVSVFIKEDN